MTLPILERTAEPAPVAEILTPPAELAAAGGLRYKATETYSKPILGATSFELYWLNVAEYTPKPWQVRPFDQPSIIDTTENMWVSLYVYFDRSPLTRLLMCLGTDVCATFHFEGFGGTAAEKDLKVCIKTEENRFLYWIGTRITPNDLGLSQGFYKVVATVEVGARTDKCGQYVFGYGYIGERNIQIARQPF